MSAPKHPVDVLKEQAEACGLTIGPEREAAMRAICDEIVTVDKFGREVGKQRAEAEHFATCPYCVQTVDMRKLGEVLHHNEPDHRPLPLDG